MAVSLNMNKFRSIQIQGVGIKCQQEGGTVNPFFIYYGNVLP